MLSAMKRATLSATTIRSRALGALILAREARDENVRAKRADFFQWSPQSWRFLGDLNIHRQMWIFG